jgi:hypothetical protein
VLELARELDVLPDAVGAQPFVALDAVLLAQRIRIERQLAHRGSPSSTVPVA